MLHLEPTNDIKALARKAFPGYTGRKYKLDNSGRSVNVTSYWDGGSRSYYAAVNLSTGATLPVPQNGTPFAGQATRSRRHGMTPAIGTSEEFFRFNNTGSPLSTLIRAGRPHLRLCLV